MLTDEQDQQVERMQARALKNIYGYTDSCAEMREKAGVTTHRARGRFFERGRMSDIAGT